MSKGTFTTVDWTCGLGVWGNFHTWADPMHTLGMGGIGYSVAGFINSVGCKEAYHWIAENKVIVFQSPVKLNTNSGNQFFFIVFKDKENEPD